MKNQHSSNPLYAYIIVALSVIIILFFWGIYFSFGVYFKPMLAEFGWNRAMISGGFSLASLLSGFVTAYLGWLNDRIGPRLVMTLCGFSLGIGCLLLSRITSLWQFYVFYGIIIGFALGGAFVPLISNVTRWFETNRGLMTGIVAAGVGVGALAGPQISSQLLMAFGWRSAYFFSGVAALIVVVIASQFLKQPPPKTLLVAYSDDDQTDPEPASESLAGVTLKEALMSGQFWILSITGFCYGYTLFSLTVHVVPYAIDLGIGPELAAGLISTYGAMSIGGKILFGKVLDKINGKRTMALGYIIMTISFLFLSSTNQTWIMFASVGLFGFFYGTCTVSQPSLIAVLFGLRSHGLILGVFGISVTFGGAVGPLVTGAIFDRFQSGATGFAICVGVCLLGLLSTITIKHKSIR